MLGKLFNLTSGSSNAVSQHNASESNQTPESIHEDIHTRSLLFPDSQALFSHQDQVYPLPASTPLSNAAPTTAFDYESDIELEPRHVRVIIMQDSLGAVHPSLLFDSHPGPAAANPNQELRRTTASGRKGSLGQPSRPLVIQPGSPQPRQGALDRRPSIHTQSRGFGYAESDTQRAAREYREELASFTSCIFANTEVMSYKGTSTKVHIVPSESRASDMSSSYVGDGRGSMGRSSMRGSRLAQSYTNESAGPHGSSAGSRQSDRKKVLVTRLFPVNLPNDDLDTSQTVASRASEDPNGFPFPPSPDEYRAKKKKSQPKQKRTPMYAVALVLQVPANTASNTAATAPKSVFRGSGSYGEHQEPFSSSYGSARRSGWTMVGSGFGADSLESAYSTDVEDRMDAITQHWDVIMRTLTHLQSFAATILHPMLRQADLSMADPHGPPPVGIPARTSSVHSRRGSDASQVKPPKTNAKLVTLAPNSLMNNQRIDREVEEARVRVVLGLCATRVVTGQGRWGPWREEARWVAKWAGGKEQGFFFFNLLTGFLATNTQWLQALSPSWYRRRHYQQQKTKSDEDTSLPTRTIIIAKDKMAARRLVFLLSAFLPANQQIPAIRAQRPTTSASFAAYGQSPPSFVVPILKEESLRRKINRRTGPRGASHNRSFSIQSQATTRSATGIPAQLAHLSIDSSRDRRTSDAPSPRTSSNLPIAGNDLNTRKSSAATSNTVTPDAAIPHFSTIHRAESHSSVHHGSTGSTAAQDLKRTLKRGDSSRASHASNNSQGHSRGWSVISGLWSARRRDSTASTLADMPSAGDSPITSPVAPRRDKLSQMVHEAQDIDPTTRAHPEQPTAHQPPVTPRDSGLFSDHSDPRNRLPDPSGAFESPVKTSINNDDGIIDVDVPFPDYLTSFETAVSSPSSSGYLSTPGLGSGLDYFEHISRIAIEGDIPLNVAGWLQRFHPDFTMQAVPPQAGLMDQVRRSLAAEPTPAVHPSVLESEWLTDHWVDVSTAIVADATNFTIKRLRYRRLVKVKGGVPSTATVDYAGGHHMTPGSTTVTPALSPYEQSLSERIEEEDLVTLDEGLIEAVERVIAYGHDASKDTSTNTSRSASQRRERSDSDASGSTGPLGLPEGRRQAMHPDLLPEVARADCKTVVLSALAEIVNGVVEEREKEVGDGPAMMNKTNHATNREKESPLRGAVRGWLENVEMWDG